MGEVEADVIGGLAIPLPVRVIARLLGVPGSDYLTFKRWSDSFLASNARALEPAISAIPNQIGWTSFCSITIRQSPSGSVSASPMTPGPTASAASSYPSRKHHLIGGTRRVGLSGPGGSGFEARTEGRHVLQVPISIYQHSVSREFGLSVQGWGSWSWDWVKAELVGAVIGDVLDGRG